MKSKQQKIKQKIEHFIEEATASGNKLFDFYYDDCEYGDDYDDEFYDETVCVTQINVSPDKPESYIRIPSFVTYLHYSVICENKDLASCKIFIPKECEIEWNAGSWETGRKQEFFKRAKEIIIEEGHPQFFYEDEVLFCGNKKVLFLYPAEKKDEEYTVPERVVVLDVDAFLGNKYLRKLNIHNKVRRIEPCGLDSRIMVEVDEANRFYKSIEGSLYSKNGKKVHHLCANEEGDIKVAEGSVTIDEIFLDEAVNALYLPKSIKPRNGATFIKNNWNMFKKALVPEELKQYLKSYEKDIAILYY